MPTTEDDPEAEAEAEAAAGAEVDADEEAAGDDEENEAGHDPGTPADMPQPAPVSPPSLSPLRPLPSPLRIDDRAARAAEAQQVRQLSIGIGIVFGVQALGLLGILIPLYGPLILFFLAPYAAGVLGGKRFAGLPALWIAAGLGAVWATVQLGILFLLLANIAFAETGIRSLVDVGLLGLIYGGNILSLVLGVRSSLPAGGRAPVIAP